MKRIVLSLIIMLTALTASAQTITYNRLMKLSKMTSVSDINATLTSWGYKKGASNKTARHESHAWGWGAAKYDEKIKDWRYQGMLWSVCTYITTPDGSHVIHSCFPLAADYTSIKNELLFDGWKQYGKTTTKLGDCISYAKAGTDDIIMLIDCTKVTTGYAVIYTWY